ncbi:hypothetical protein BU17DRAFT_83362 [Hysterangium stoloniferum]|nr:hypothetical protein BU17DRAFT_83362 [Hysterangium stoloniferum]
MNLQTLFPSLPEGIHQGLLGAGIVTTHDILFSDISQLYQRLPSGLLSLRELSELRSDAAARVAAPATRGDELFTQQEERETIREECLCGVEKIDALLGGFGRYGVTEIAGDKKSGKTGLVMNIVIRHLASHPTHTACWIDSGGEFDIERAAEIVQLHNGPGRETALDRLNIIQCFDIATAHQTLEDLQVSLAAEREITPRTRFLIIDPITPLLGPLLTATSSQGHAVMVTFMRQVASLARIYSLTALVTNNSVQSHPENPYSAFSTTVTKPALGPSFTYLSDDTLWLFDAQKLVTSNHPHQEARIFIAEVFRSHNTFSKRWDVFMMRNGVTLEPYEPTA